METIKMLWIKQLTYEYIRQESNTGSIQDGNIPLQDGGYSQKSGLTMFPWSCIAKI
jgi:hypothetical protein